MSRKMTTVLNDGDVAVNEIKLKVMKAQNALKARQYDTVRRLLSEILDKL